jgi:hypothetical protein
MWKWYEILARLLGWWVTPDLDDLGATSPLPTRYPLMADRHYHIAEEEHKNFYT